MAWGRPGATAGIDDFVSRIAANDPTLKSLHILPFRQLDHEGVKALCRALEGNQYLAELACSSHVLSPEAAALFGAMLANGGCPIQSLSVGNSTFGDAGVQAMQAGLSANQSLTHLDLEQKGLTEAGAASLAQCLAVHPALRSLALGKNDIGDHGLSALSNAPWKRLEQLDLASCGITYTGVAALARAPSLALLRQLDLSGNSLGPEAGQHLAQLLTQASALGTLKLEGTALGDAGVEALAGALAGSQSLQTLELGSCGVAERGCAALAAAISHNATFGRLGLAFNAGLSDVAVGGLAKAMHASSRTANGAASTVNSTGAHTPNDGAGAMQPGHVSVCELDLAGAAVGPLALAALGAAQGLQRLRLFSALGQPSSAAHLAAALGQPGAFAALQELDIAACGMDAEALQQVLGAVMADGAVPQLQALVVGANPGVNEDAFEVLLEECAARRPRLDVHWRSGAGQEGGHAA